MKYYSRFSSFGKEHLDVSYRLSCNFELTKWTITYLVILHGIVTNTLNLDQESIGSQPWWVGIMNTRDIRNWVTFNPQVIETQGLTCLISNSLNFYIQCSQMMFSASVSVNGSVTCHHGHVIPWIVVYYLAVSSAKQKSFELMSSFKLKP